MKKARFGIVVVLALAALAVVATVATTASGKSSAGPPIVIGAAVDLTSSMKPFDSPALAGAQIEAKKLAAAGGPNFVIKVCNHQLKKQKYVRRAADPAGRQDRDRHVRRRVRRRRDAGVHQPRDPHDRPLRDHRPDGPAALRREGQARVHDRRHRPGRGLGRRRVRLLARLADGDRRQGQLPRLLPRRLRRVREALPGARREDRRPRSPSPRSTRTIGNVISKVAGEKADVISFVTAFGELPQFVGGIRSAGQHHADHQLVGRRRHVLEPEEPAGDRLLRRQLRVVVRRRPEPGGEQAAQGAARGEAGPVHGQLRRSARRRSTRSRPPSSETAARRDGLEAGHDARELQERAARSPGRSPSRRRCTASSGRPWRIMKVQNNKETFVRMWKTK